MIARRSLKSDAFEAIHSSASAMFRVGAIDKATMREFGETCLTGKPAMAPVEIEPLREAGHVSEPVLALPSAPAKPVET